MSMVLQKRNISSPDMIMIHFTGGKGCIIQKTKNYVGSAVDLHFVTAFVLSSQQNARVWVST